jgi:23S rRNA (cytosine1962-C5)-methyltransferase
MDDDSPTPRLLPTVRLKPKADARAIRHGFPWVYADELVTDRRTQSLAPGALAVLEDGDRRAMGLVTVNVNSKIIARMLDRDPEAVRWRTGHGFTRSPFTGWCMPRRTVCPVW